MTYVMVPAGLFALALAGARAVLRPMAGIVVALRNRGAVLRLAELDDRALKDIGLVRGDVTGALGEPLHVDPSRWLALRRGEGTSLARRAGRGREPRSRLAHP